MDFVHVCERFLQGCNVLLRVCLANQFLAIYFVGPTSITHLPAISTCL